MTGLAPLLFIWALSRGTSSSTPAWPSSASPPPPAPPAPPPLPAAPAPNPPPAEPGPPIKPAAKRRAPPRKMIVPEPPQTNVSVANIQSILNKRGSKLKRDGLYGPLTESAWYALAQQKKLSPMIRRVNARTARVATNTLTNLSVPAIP